MNNDRDNNEMNRKPGQLPGLDQEQGRNVPSAAGNSGQTGNQGYAGQPGPSQPGPSGRPDQEHWKQEAQGGSARKGFAAAIRRHKGVTIFLIIVAIIFIVGIALGKDSGKPEVSGNTVTLGTDSTLKMNDDYIGQLHIDGEITSEASSFGSSSYDQEWIISRISDMKKDGHNKAILLNINSPGGDAYATSQVYKALMDYKTETGRPVFAYMKSEAASGGYYIAMASNMIYADEECWVGSIGVRTGYIYDVTGLLKKLGVKVTIISSGKNKTMGDPASELTDEQKEIMQGLIDDSYGRFVGVVAKGRGMSEKKVRRLADGRIYTAKQGVENGLIDEIKDYDAAVAEIKDEQGLKGVKVYDLKKSNDESLVSSLLSGMAALRPQSDSTLDEVNKLLTGTNMKVMYLSDIRK